MQKETKTIVIIVILLVLIGFFIIKLNIYSYSLDYVSPELTEDVTDNWITLSTNGRYFVFEDKTDFYPIGTALNGAYLTYDATAEELEEYIKSMKSNNENFLRIDLEGFSWDDDYDNVKRKIKDGTIGFLENPPGVFNEKYAKKIDNLIELTEKYDIYLQLVFSSHSCTLGDKFDLYPYGSLVDSTEEFLSDDVVEELFKQRIRYSVDRWGNSPNVFMWELWNEIDNPPLCGSSDAKDIEDWVEEMGMYLREYETLRYGKSHLIGVSSYKFGLKSGYDFFLDTKGTDVLQTHFYEPTGGVFNPVNNALKVKDVVNRFVVSSNKPYLENERVPLMFFIDDAGLIHQNQQYFIWSYLASGAAGSGALWHDAQAPSYVSRSSRKIYPFIQAIDFSDFNSKPYSDKISSSNSEVEVFAIGDDDKIVGWLMHDNPNDYNIDVLNWWRQGKASGKLKINSQDFLYVKLWKDILQDEGVNLKLDSLIDDISLTLQFKTEMSKQKADNFANSLIKDSESLKDFMPKIKEFAVAKGKSVITNVSDEILDKIISHFEELESEHNTLENLYQGHPSISTHLYISSFEGENLVIRWYDSNTGAWLNQEDLKNLEIDSPNFSRHIAFIITSN